jgi:hypothetical protein
VIRVVEEIEDWECKAKLRKGQLCSFFRRIRHELDKVEKVTGLLMLSTALA